MMGKEYTQRILQEDQLVAELNQLGVTYLSTPATRPPEDLRSPAHLIADTIRQPSSRVRSSVIALFLMNPSYNRYLQEALNLIDEEHQQGLKLFYTAAVYLQQVHHHALRLFVITEWEWLPDRFREELGISSNLSSQEAIFQLGIRHQQLTHSMTNWYGTYQNVVHHLIRYKQREAQWNQLPHKPSKNF